MVLKFVAIALVVSLVKTVDAAEKDKCPRPSNPANGKVKIDSGVIKIGSAAKVTCKENYELSGSEVRRCQETGTWTGIEPDCGRLCIFPPLVHREGLRFEINPNNPNPLSIIAGNVMVHKITFRCSGGYTVKGSARIRCQPDGKWNHKPPRCVKSDTQSRQPATVRSPPQAIEGYCRKLSDIPNGNYSKVTHIVGASSVSTEGQFPVGTVVHFECKENYVLGSAGSRRRAITRTCFQSGEWSGREPFCTAECGKSEQPLKPHVVGGWAANPNQFPWQAALTYRAITSDPVYRRIICGAVLLSERWVVTAAHCVHVGRTKEQRKASELLIIFGKHYYNRNLDDNDADSRKLAQIIVHDNYDPSSLDYDIALILLETSINFTTKVLPVCLPPASFALNVGTNGTVSGWGFVDQNETLPKQLMTTQLPVVESEKCEKSHHVKVTERMFCAGFDQGGTNACEGDSGGPFVVWNDDHYVLQGLVSWGNADDCAGAGFYGAFVRVSHLVEWIRGLI